MIFIFIPSYEKLVQILLLFWWLYNVLFCWHHSLTYGELLVPTFSISLKNQVLGVASIQWLLHLLFKNIWEGHTSRSVVYSHRSFCLNSLCGLFPWWTEPDHGGGPWSSSLPSIPSPGPHCKLVHLGLHDRGKSEPQRGRKPWLPLGEVFSPSPMERCGAIVTWCLWGIKRTSSWG